MDGKTNPKKKLQKGWRPSLDDGWVVVKFRIVRGWDLYMKDGEDWVNIKLVSREPRRGKANYSLSWSLKEQRYAKSADRRDLIERDPELYELVGEQIVDRYYGGDLWNM